MGSGKVGLVVLLVFGHDGWLFCLCLCSSGLSSLGSFSGDLGRLARLCLCLCLNILAVLLYLLSFLLDDLLGLFGRLQEGNDAGVDSEDVSRVEQCVGVANLALAVASSDNKSQDSPFVRST